MLNKIILKGNVGRAPHIAVDQRGREIATFFLATSTSWKDASGEWQRHVDWHHIMVFRGSTVRWIKDILKKGDTVYIEGKLTYHQWTDKYNQIRITPTIVVAGFEGKVEHIRSKNPAPHSSTQDTETQEVFLKDFEGNPSHFLKATERK